MRGSKARAIRKNLSARGVDIALERGSRAYQRILRATKKFIVPIHPLTLNTDGTPVTHEVEVQCFQVLGPQGRRLCKYVKKRMTRGA